MPGQDDRRGGPSRPLGGGHARTAITCQRPPHIEPLGSGKQGAENSDHDAMDVYVVAQLREHLEEMNPLFVCLGCGYHLLWHAAFISEH